MYAFKTQKLIDHCRTITLGAVTAIALQGANMSAAQAQAKPFEEYGRQWGLASIGVLFPWGAGAIGSGSVIALVDSGVSAGHPDLAGKIIPGVDFVDGDANANDDSGSSHGTFIAGIAVGNRNGNGIVGTAYDARIIPVRIGDSSNKAPSERVAQGINWAAGSRARIINLARAGGAEAGQAVQNALANAGAAGKAVVMPAGNAGGAGPMFPAQYVGILGGQGIVVGSLSPAGGISAFSNRAGGLRDHFVVAPGESVTSATRNGSFSTSSGTSWATGFVSGSLALLLGAFPDLSAKDAIDILKTTATDLGAPGVDSTYGWGAINVRRALAPSGDLEVPSTGGSSGGIGGAVVVAALVVASAVAWKRMKKKESLKQTLINDGFGRGYTADISGMIQPRDEGTDLENTVLSLRREYGATGVMLGDNSSAGLSWSVDRVESDLARRDLRADDLDRNDPDWSMSFNGELRPGMHWSMQRNMKSDSGFGFDNRYSNHAVDTSGFRRSRTLNGAHLGFAPQADSVSFGFQSNTGTDLKLGLMSTDEDERYGRISETAAVEAGWNVTDRTRVSMSLSQTTEDGSLLGGASGGPFSVSESVTTAVGLNGRVRVNESVSLIGSWSTGKTEVSERPGAMLQDVSDIDSNAWGVGLVSQGVFRKDDVLGIAVSRPLRVTSGNGTLTVPFGRSIGGGLLTRSEGWDMAPDKAETDLEFFYQRRVGKDTRLGAWFMYQDAPFHSDEVEDRMSFFTTISRDF